MEAVHSADINLQAAETCKKGSYHMQLKKQKIAAAMCMLGVLALSLTACGSNKNNTNDNNNNGGAATTQSQNQSTTGQSAANNGGMNNNNATSDRTGTDVDGDGIIENAADNVGNAVSEVGHTAGDIVQDGANIVDDAVTGAANAVDDLVGGEQSTTTTNNQNR